MRYWVFYICMSVISISAKVSACDHGKEYYESETYHFFRGTHCVSCHSGSHPQAPIWLSHRADLSYARVKGYIDFSNLNNSKLMTQAGNGHCGSACQNLELQKSILENLKAWWEGGEKDCQNYHLSDPLEISYTSLSSFNFTPLSWYFSLLSSQWQGVQFHAEVKLIASADGASTPAGFIVRKPRFSIHKEGIRLRIDGLHILLNNMKQPFTDQFRPIQVTVEKANVPVLSNDIMILQNDRSSSAVFTIGLENFEFL